MNLQLRDSNALRLGDGLIESVKLWKPFKSGFL